MSSLPPTTESDQDAPAVLAVAYDEQSRAALAASTAAYGIRGFSCASFREAQEHALDVRFSGVLVDLVTMVKAKEEEKLIAHTLTELYPTLRVKSMGSLLIPMIMPGNAQQDKSLNDFFSKTCAGFTARTLRHSRRRDICLPVLIGTERSATLNLSWDGAFIVAMTPERYSVGERLAMTLMVEGHGLNVDVTVKRLQPWGERRLPGMGVAFENLTGELGEALLALLRVQRSEDRDRLT